MPRTNKFQKITINLRDGKQIVIALDVPGSGSIWQSLRSDHVGGERDAAIRGLEAGLLCLACNGLLTEGTETNESVQNAWDRIQDFAFVK